MLVIGSAAVYVRSGVQQQAQPMYVGNLCPIQAIGSEVPMHLSDITNIHSDELFLILLGTCCTFVNAAVFLRSLLSIFSGGEGFF